MYFLKLPPALQSGEQGIAPFSWNCLELKRPIVNLVADNLVRAGNAWQRGECRSHGKQDEREWKVAFHLLIIALPAVLVSKMKRASDVSNVLRVFQR